MGCNDIAVTSNDSQALVLAQDAFSIASMLNDNSVTKKLREKLRDLR